MAQLTVISRRLYQKSDAISMATNLEHIASDYIAGGWEVKRGIAGVIILALQDGEIHFVPTGKGIEEIIFERRTNNE